MIPLWAWELMAICTLLALYAAYRWGEYNGSTALYDHLMRESWPKPKDRVEPEEVPLLDDTFMDPADIPITVHTGAEIIELEQTATKAVTQAKRYRTRAINLEQAEKDRLHKRTGPIVVRRGKNQ
jgi:hypothetical protein